MSVKINAGSIVLVIIIALIAALGIRYITLDKLRKTYLNSILEQVPNLIARYMV